MTDCHCRSCVGDHAGFGEHQGANEMTDKARIEYSAADFQRAAEEWVDANRRVTEAFETEKLATEARKSHQQRMKDLEDILAASLPGPGTEVVYVMPDPRTAVRVANAFYSNGTMVCIIRVGYVGPKVRE